MGRKKKEKEEGERKLNETGSEWTYEKLLNGY